MSNILHVARGQAVALIERAVAGLLDGIPRPRGASPRSPPVRILIDHCIDSRLGRSFPTHHVKRARDMGWEALRNGALLAAPSSPTARRASTAATAGASSAPSESMGTSESMGDIPIPFGPSIVPHGVLRGRAWVRLVGWLVGGESKGGESKGEKSKGEKSKGTFTLLNCECPL